MRVTERGFTLMEMMIVVAIIAMLVGIVSVRMGGLTDEARVARVQADISSIEKALEIYKNDNFVYPSSDQGLQALLEKPSIEPVPRNWRQGGYLSAMPKDPWGYAYHYLSPGTHAAPYDIYSYGADGVRGGEGANADIGNWSSQ